jgi:hypothetical protein
LNARRRPGRHRNRIEQKELDSRGEIRGPLGLALIVGSSNFVKPDVPVPEIPIAFLYLGSWFLMAGAVGGRSIEKIDRDLGRGLQPS